MRFLQGTGLLPTADELAPLDDDQSSAILECLFLTMLADGRIAPEEVSAFTMAALAYPWRWGPSADVIKGKLEAIGRRLGGASRDTMKAHLANIGPRIPTPVLREKTFAGMFALMLVDGNLDETEKHAALAFAGNFDIAPQRATEIISQVMQAFLARD
jgi:uncharacterized tellurite resistance protein B-like protein